jgi:uncharacterized protein YjlB
METDTHALFDDGRVPNNPKLPLVIYHDVFAQGTTADEALALFAGNGWSGGWVNGIFDFHHYHARSHEVLANLGASVTVQFGGEAGPVLEFCSGAGVVIPAGGGHCRVSGGAGLLIVGAYPSGQEDWDLKRGDNPEHYRLAKDEIVRVGLPDSDPFGGVNGPLLELWQQ